MFGADNSNAEDDDDDDIKDDDDDAGLVSISGTTIRLLAKRSYSRR